MANPPISIGPFTNVPAPGSPIRSDWPQQISTVVADHIPRIASLEAIATGAVAGKFRIWSLSTAINPSAGAGAFAIAIPAGTFTGKPFFAWIDDLYTASGQPSQWTYYKIDGANTSNAQIAGQAVDFVTGTPRLGGSYLVNVVAFGVRP